MMVTLTIDVRTVAFILRIIVVASPSLTGLLIFTGPRCLLGPVYGSRSLYVHPRPLVETLLM